MATTTVRLEGLRSAFRIGVSEEERRKAQVIVLDIVCDLGSLPLRRDELGATMDYVRVYEDIRGLAADSTFVLLETLAEAIAYLCFSDSRVLRVTVRARKAKKLQGCHYVGVERTFDRSEARS